MVKTPTGFFFINSTPYKNMKKKYKLTNKTIKYRGHILHQIQALKDFKGIKKGDLGGWVESEINLSQEGDCWITDKVRVLDGASVNKNAYVKGNVLITDNAIITDEVLIDGNNAIIHIADGAIIYDRVLIVGLGDILINGETQITGDVMINGSCRITNNF